MPRPHGEVDEARAHLKDAEKRGERDRLGPLRPEMAQQIDDVDGEPPGDEAAEAHAGDEDEKGDFLQRWRDALLHGPRRKGSGRRCDPRPQEPPMKGRAEEEMQGGQHETGRAPADARRRESSSAGQATEDATPVNSMRTVMARRAPAPASCATATKAEFVSSMELATPITTQAKDSSSTRTKCRRE